MRKLKTEFENFDARNIRKIIWKTEWDKHVHNIDNKRSIFLETKSFEFLVDKKQKHLRLFGYFSQAF